MNAQHWNDDQALEADPRFRSGRWIGYWRQDSKAGKMELSLTFGGGRLFGEGRDLVGDFVLSGSYNCQTGTCTIHKAYLGQHGVDYDGAAHGDGIRGSWRILSPESGLLGDAGPFHIWPIGDGEGLALETATEIRIPLG
ncbi:MAG: hypothetical protein ACKVS9_16290 [Phycisphaerae bacterium]